MDRISKAFAFAFVAIVLVAVGIAFPILFVVLGAFVAGTILGGGGVAFWYGTKDDGSSSGILVQLFKQFRKPEKTDTPKKRTPSKKPTGGKTKR